METIRLDDLDELKELEDGSIRVKDGEDTVDISRDAAMDISRKLIRGNVRRIEEGVERMEP